MPELSGPLKIVNRDMFNVNQLQLQYSKKTQAASGPNPETQLAISSPKTMITMSPMTQSFKNQKTVVTSTARVRDVGGLKTREAGLGPGSRHGMSGRDIGTIRRHVVGARRRDKDTVDRQAWSSSH